jgi:hypothetical protein
LSPPTSRGRAQRSALDPLADPAQFEAAFQRAFSIVAFMANRHLVDHMMRASRAFDLDFEMLVIWAVVAHQNAAHLMPPGSMPSAALTDGGMLPDEAAQELRPLRLRDVSQITGIPRETARRKLKKLEERGWLIESRDGWVVDRTRIGPELRAFSLETVRRFLATANDLVRALEDAQRQF